jgi:hypothetical protein
MFRIIHSFSEVSALLAPLRLEGLGKLKKCIGLIGSRTRDLPAFAGQRFTDE